MTKQTTDTSGRSLTPENHYEATINKIVNKEVKGFNIYEWSFESLLDDKPFYFKLGMFTSQMAELLRALGATETSPNKFDWDDEDYIGVTLSFNLVHVADKKGVLREQLSDIKRLTPANATTGDPARDVNWAE